MKTFYVTVDTSVRFSGWIDAKDYDDAYNKMIDKGVEDLFEDMDIQHSNVDLSSLDIQEM